VMKQTKLYFKGNDMDRDVRDNFREVKMTTTKIYDNLIRKCDRIIWLGEVATLMLAFLIGVVVTSLFW